MVNQESRFKVWRPRSQRQRVLKKGSRVRIKSRARGDWRTDWGSFKKSGAEEYAGRWVEKGEERNDLKGRRNLA